MHRQRNGQGVRPIVVNFGCATAVTGKGGLEDTESMGIAVEGASPLPATPKAEP